jgi:D-glycero-D-manno-heptose 1,7-bisphosphate phosphatase
MAAKKAIFLDKDGTLIPDIPYNADPEKIKLNEGVIAGLTLLKKEYEFYIVTNQSGLAKGYFNAAQLASVAEKISELLGSYQIPIAGFYYCPHDDTSATACDCRKPKPGLIQRAAADHQIDPSHSWMIGDILNDVEAGKNAGCRAILINNGNETEWKYGANPNRVPDYIGQDFLSAAAFIFKQTKS